MATLNQMTQQRVEQIIEKEYSSFINKTIVEIRPLRESELKDIGWDEDSSFSELPICIIFTDGQVLIPASDPEANRPGFLLTADVQEL
jgi:hypothetical protein